MVNLHACNEESDLKKIHCKKRECSADTKRLKSWHFLGKNVLMFMENMTRDSHTLVAPIPKTKTSVKVVTVIETPACFIVLPIFSDKLSSAGEGSSSTLDQQVEITNMSSIPIPKQN